MTIDEAIYHLQELADSKFEQMRRYDRASGYAISHNEDIRTADAKRLEQRAKECIQLAGWLKDYERLKEQEPIESVLDDIKAEIKRKTNSGQWSDAVIFGMQKALAIIDKHKAESEG